MIENSGNYRRNFEDSMIFKNFSECDEDHD